MSLKQAVLFAFVLTAGLGSALAESIVGYNYSSNLNATSQSAAVQSTSTTASAAMPILYVGNDGQGNVAEAYSGAATTTAATALSNGNYFSVVVNLTPGSVMDLTDLTFEVGAGDSYNWGVRGYVIRTSTDGFTSDLYAGTFPSATQFAPAEQTVDLTGADFQDLSSIDFRFYVYNPRGSQSTDFRNLSLDGTIPETATPEPVSGILVLSGLGAMALRRRLRKSK